MHRWYLLLFVMLPLAPSAFAQDSARYGRCLDVADKSPAIALADAEGWIRSGGGAPAAHCAAMAQVRLKRYPDAAARLERLARAADTPAAMRAEIFTQAGNAWLLAGNGAKAVTNLQSALSLSTGDADLYADLGRAEAMIRNWRDAVTHLTTAIAMRPGSADLLLLRASAQRALRQYKPALADLTAALKLQPNNAALLMERGLLRRDLGDVGGARTDFTAAQKSGSPALRAEAGAALDALKE
jgi:tetratricopeptide (TPR) repeat protein